MTVISFQINQWKIFSLAGCTGDYHSSFGVGNFRVYFCGLYWQPLSKIQKITWAWSILFPWIWGKHSYKFKVSIFPYNMFMINQKLPVPRMPAIVFWFSWYPLDFRFINSDWLILQKHTRFELLFFFFLFLVLPF